MGDFSLKMKQFSSFELPYAIDLDKVDVQKVQVFEQGTIDKMKNVMKEAFTKTSNLKEAGEYAKKSLEESEDGIWFCGAWFEGMKNGQYWQHQGALLAFERDDM